MVPRQVTRIRRETESSIRQVVATNHQSRHLAAESIIEDIAHRQPRRSLPSGAVGIQVRHGDVVSGVAEYKFVQQRGADGVGQPRQHTRSRTIECALQGGKVVLHRSPLRRQNGGVPGVVNITERGLHARGNVMVQLEEFLAPISAGRNHRVEARSNARIATCGGIGQRNNIGVQQRYGVGVDRDHIAGIGQKRPDLRRTVVDSRAIGVFCPGEGGLGSLHAVGPR